MVTRSAQPFASSESRNTHEPGVKTVIKSVPRQTIDSQTAAINTTQSRATQIRIIKNKTADTKATRKSRITSAADARPTSPATLPAANPNGDYVIEIVTELDDVASERMVARLAQQLRGINAQRYTRMRGSQRLNIIVLNAYAELGEALRIRDALPRHIGIHEPTVTLKTLVREAANNRLIDIYRSAPQPTPNS